MDKAYDPPQVAKPTIVAADAADLPALAAALGQNAARLEQHLSRPRARPEFTRIAVAAGQIVGWALLGHIRIGIGPATIEAGVIHELVASGGDDSTFTQLVGDTLRVLGESGLPLALVRGQRARFEPFGFVPYQLHVHTQQQLGGHKQQLRALDQNDIDDLDALYRATYAALPLHVVRAAPDWRALLEDGGAWGLDDGRGRLVAYARVQSETMHEAAAADASAARALLDALPDHELALPLAHPVTQAALQLGGVTTVAAPSGEILALAGVVDLPTMLEQLVPAFDQRLLRSRYAGWSGNIRVEIETERVTLAFADGRAEVIDGSRPADLRLRRVALGALAQCCLGYRSISDLRATHELDCDDSALGLLEILFPAL